MWNDKAIAIDWRGVPRVTYDELVREIWRGEFGPFGEPLYERGVVSNYIPFRLYGMYKDMETGLYYNVRRYYDWRIGRYLQPDPVSDLNLYAYTDNSPHDLVDPLGMFKTRMQVLGEFWHAGPPKHEEITEDAASSLRWKYPKLYQQAFRVENWDGGPWAFGAQCRGPANTLAQGVNRADCFYSDNSSFHCDNNNFDGCWGLANKVKDAFDIVSCSCVYSPPYSPPPSTPSPYPPPPNWSWPPPEDKTSSRGCSSGKGSQSSSSLPPPKVEDEGGGRGCSKGSQAPPHRPPIGSLQRLKNKGYNRCQYFFPSRPEECKCVCSFKVAISPGISDLGQMDYEKLGRLLHPIQDFWSHSTAIYVPGCKTKKCVSSVFGACLDYECAEYYRYYYWTNLDIPMSTQARNAGLRTGWFGANGWGALEDFGCLWPPCNAHCMLNKDDGSFSRDDFSPCDGNIQKDAHWEVKSKATDSTKHHLDLFCKGLGGICF